jgi:hypothetical protein
MCIFLQASMFSYIIFQNSQESKSKLTCMLDFFHPDIFSSCLCSEKLVLNTKNIHAKAVPFSANFFAHFNFTLSILHAIFTKFSHKLITQASNCKLMSSILHYNIIIIKSPNLRSLRTLTCKNSKSQELKHKDRVLTSISFSSLAM